jgi:hypothetical protein
MRDIQLAFWLYVAFTSKTLSWHAQGSLSKCILLLYLVFLSSWPQTDTFPQYIALHKRSFLLRDAADAPAHTGVALLIYIWHILPTHVLPKLCSTKVMFYQSHVLLKSCSTKVRFYQSQVLSKSILPKSGFPGMITTKVRFA